MDKLVKDQWQADEKSHKLLKKNHKNVISSYNLVNLNN